MQIRNGDHCVGAIEYRGLPRHDFIEVLYGGGTIYLQVHKLLQIEYNDHYYEYVYH